MALPTFVINGTITLAGVKAEWQRAPKRVNADGTTTWQNYALHTWEIPQMTMANFESLRALQGTQLTSLATTTLADRNVGATYTVVEVGLVNCQQVGRRATNVHLEFRVDIS
jgi:hypothetical protein